jgi:hypothetical protein
MWLSSPVSGSLQPNLPVHTVRRVIDWEIVLHEKCKLLTLHVGSETETCT